MVGYWRGIPEKFSCRNTWAVVGPKVFIELIVNGGAATTEPYETWWKVLYIDICTNFYNKIVGTHPIYLPTESNNHYPKDSLKKKQFSVNKFRHKLRYNGAQAPKKFTYNKLYKLIGVEFFAFISRRLWTPVMQFWSLVCVQTKIFQNLQFAIILNKPLDRLISAQ